MRGSLEEEDSAHEVSRLATLMNRRRLAEAANTTLHSERMPCM